MERKQTRNPAHSSCGKGAIFAYDCYLEFLKDRLATLNLTHQKLAVCLGYASKGTVSMVMTGNRLPSRALVSRISAFLKLTEAEQFFFELLVDRHRANPSYREDVLEQVNPVLTDQTYVNDEVFRIISNWYHLPLKELVTSPDFHPNLDEIALRLRGKVSHSEIFYGLQRLTSLGFIRRDAKGRYHDCTQGIATSTDVPSSAGRQHHAQMMTRAQEAMEEQLTADREISSVTLRIDRKHFNEAKAAIVNFRESFRKRFSSGTSSDIYQLNLQFFSHTTSIEAEETLE